DQQGGRQVGVGGGSHTARQVILENGGIAQQSAPPGFFLRKPSDPLQQDDGGEVKTQDPKQKEQPLDFVPRPVQSPFNPHGEQIIGQKHRDGDHPDGNPGNPRGIKIPTDRGQDEESDEDSLRKTPDRPAPLDDKGGEEADDQKNNRRQPRGEDNGHDQSLNHPGCQVAVKIAAQRHKLL